eukprot:TRINITY_DN13095_c0_g1_i4.p1 TRINITY_DN13095_c0_g1~~TRINITY_DN13095_c0_g1_i4.p1  ORF type:complete len:403 (+),score=50.43 TRINITY_DN13095_c0_g1_i4:887-2095(+)
MAHHLVSVRACDPGRNSRTVLQSFFLVLTFHKMSDFALEGMNLLSMENRFRSRLFDLVVTPFQPGKEYMIVVVLLLCVVGLFASVTCVVTEWPDHPMQFIQLGGVVYIPTLLEMLLLYRYCHAPHAHESLCRFIEKAGFASYFSRLTQIFVGTMIIPYFAYTAYSTYAIIYYVILDLDYIELWCKVYQVVKTPVQPLVIVFAIPCIWPYILTARNYCLVIRRFVDAAKTADQKKLQESLELLPDSVLQVNPPLGDGATCTAYLIRAHKAYQQGLKEASALWEFSVCFVLVFQLGFFVTLGVWSFKEESLFYVAPLSLLGFGIGLLLFITLLVNTASQPLAGNVFENEAYGTFTERLALSNYLQSTEGQLHLKLYGFALTKSFVVGICTTFASAVLASLAKRL